MTSQYARTVSDIRPTVWVYKDESGEIREREQTQEERQQQQIPPKGEYRLKVKAFAAPFEMTRHQDYGGGVQTMTRLLLEVVGGPGNGKRTNLLVSYAVSKKSNLGKVYGATVGMPAPGEDWDPVLMLEKEFTAYLQPSKNLDENGKPKGTDCSWDTVAAIGEAAASTGTDDTWA